MSSGSSRTPKGLTRTARARLIARRLGAQLITRHPFTGPEEVVGWLGAVQAQDFPAARWAVGLRLEDGPATDASVADAVDRGVLIRTHAFRCTWQLIEPRDVRWMLALVAPRIAARLETRHRQLGLEAGAFRRSNALLEKALRDGTHLTRNEIAVHLGTRPRSATGVQLSFLLARAELDGLICNGARRGKQRTYALLDHRVPGHRIRLERDAALAELARRYFRSRGPATLGDFTWWSGLTAAEARAGLEAVRSTLLSVVVDGVTYWHAEFAVPSVRSPKAHLLPAFDEYLVAYRDREAVLDPEHVHHHNSGGGFLSPCVVLDGRVIGTWRRVLGRGTVELAFEPFERMTDNARLAVFVAARRYLAFLGCEANERDLLKALRVARA